MNQNFFENINKKVFAAIEPQGFEKNSVESPEEAEIAALYTGENVAYMVVYYTDKKHILLRTCSMTEDGPDNEWKTMSTWMFDPDADDSKEADSIGNDFAETLSAPVRIRATKNVKKKKNSDEGTNDPLFFSKRMMNLFPELQEEIREEEDGYDPFRGVTFSKTSIVPKVNTLLSQGNKKQVEKLAAVLNAQYTAGDLDTRSIITIVVLNGINTKENADKLAPALSEDLTKAWNYAKKYKGKVVKPEKVKAKKPSMAERLAGGE